MNKIFNRYRSIIPLCGFLSFVAHIAVASSASAQSSTPSPTPPKTSVEGDTKAGAGKTAEKSEKKSRQPRPVGPAAARRPPPASPPTTLEACLEILGDVHPRVIAARLSPKDLSDVQLHAAQTANHCHHGRYKPAFDEHDKLIKYLEKKSK
jgi:ribosome-binding protein aMBF1 (putative translation factor)